MGFPSEDIGAFIKGYGALALATGATAASTATGLVFDRRDSLTSHYVSCKVTAVMSYAKTSVGAWTVTPRLQHSSSSASSTFANFSTGGAIALVAADSTGTGQVAVGEIDTELRTAKRYLRMMCILGSRTSVAGNTYNVMGHIMFGGADELPAA